MKKIYFKRILLLCFFFVLGGVAAMANFLGFFDMRGHGQNQSLVSYLSKIPPAEASDVGVCVTCGCCCCI